MYPLTKPRTFPILYGVLIAIIAAVLVTVALTRPFFLAVEEDGPLAADTMSRSVSTGWDSADTGGVYTASPADSGSVSHGSAYLASPAPGATATMTF